MKRIYQHPASSTISFDEEAMLAVSELEIEMDSTDQVDAEEIDVRMFGSGLVEGG